ncbi:MAG: GTP cyclohydrolase II [Candidatus Poseidonia sp.]|jgi:GTP cyclohydrolase II|nr:GTP cyclohydrolase II [Poseidonia sp.]|tara:strand:- start:567 stop:1175 length:609 start_codon:yes stop_codon:yes gene_type:complete
MTMTRSDVPSVAFLPTVRGDFKIQVFHEATTGFDHVALTLGDMKGPDPVLVRVHSECLTGDVFASTRCDCGPQLHAALDAIVEKGWGALLYLRQEGRGIGLHAKIQAYHLQDQGADTLDANLMLGHPADARDYAIAANILADLGVEQVNLLTNNPEKVDQLTNHGIQVASRTPLIVGVGAKNRDYLATKGERMGHHITDEDL